MKKTAELFDAVKNGDLEQIKQLISSGADPNCRDEQRRTPLMLAVNKPFKSSDDLKPVQLLLSCGADLNLQDNQGNFALYYADDRIFESQAKYLSGRHRQESIPLIMLTDFYDCLDRFPAYYHSLQFRRSVYKKYRYRFELFRMLCNQGADLKMGNSHGTTALMHACEDRDVVKAYILLGYDATLACQLDAEGDYPISYAASCLNRIDVD